MFSITDLLHFAFLRVLRNNKKHKFGNLNYQNKTTRKLVYYIGVSGFIDIFYFLFTFNKFPTLYIHGTKCTIQFEPLYLEMHNNIMVLNMTYGRIHYNTRKEEFCFQNKI